MIDQLLLGKGKIKKSGSWHILFTDTFCEAIHDQLGAEDQHGEVARYTNENSFHFYLFILYANLILNSVLNCFITARPHREI